MEDGEYIENVPQKSTTPDRCLAHWIKEMRVFFLSYAYEKGLVADAGGFRKLWELAHALQGLGHEVCVFYPRLPGFVPLRDVPCRAYAVLHCPVLRPVTAYLSMFGTVLRVGSCLRPDVVYFRTGLNVLPLWLGEVLKARVVLEVNADPTEFFQNQCRSLRARLVTAAERLNVRSSNLVVALTPGLKRMLIERYGIPLDKVRVISSGTDPNHFCLADPKEAKQQLGFALDQPMVGFVGLFYRHQGVHTLIEAVPRILAEAPRVRFLLVGDGVMRPAWEALARRLGVSQVVHFTGQIPYQALPPFLQAMDLVVAPFTADRGETSPFKVLDALACGRPVIASALPSVRRLAEECDGTIMLTPPDNVDALAQAVLSLLRDPLRCQDLGTQGRASILRRYTWEVIARELEAVMEAL